DNYLDSHRVLVDNGEASTDIVFLITGDSGDLIFTLEIPPEGLTGYGEESRGVGDEMKYIVEDIDSIDWPDTNRPSDWKFSDKENDLKKTLNLKITIDLSKIDENFPMEWEIEFPQTEAGSGMIETNDWSSHQRRQTAEEGETDPGEEFSGPDGKGEVYGGDNPEITTVRLVKTEFETFSESTAGPDKPHDLNMDTKQEEADHYAPYEKAVSVIWSDDDLDMAKFLVGYDDSDLKRIFHDHLHWRVDEGEWTSDHELDLGDSLSDNLFRRFNIQVAADSNEDSIIDYLIITVIPEATKTAFDTWYSDQKDNMGWLEQLPPVYGSLILSNGEIESPDDPENCDLWFDPEGDYDSFYHPDGDVEMRSRAVENGAGHQAIYKVNGSTISLLRADISAGTADRVAPINLMTTGNHFFQDVLPFIQAAQLDGNPVSGTGGSNLSGPILHEGYYLKQYLEVRPPIVDGSPILNPGECPPND
ncbi:MAG: hypothetical protein LAT55_07010, partial [Opitutales bacterium]|nr:hypothetical protein [Opitutales bacterium]